jgi:very-short-patch-repair endonuclease
MRLPIKCSICGKQFKALTWKHLRKHGLTIFEYDEKFGKTPHGVAPILSEEAKQNRARLIKGRAPWNKGLTKENNDSLKRISETRMGQNNPVHKIKDIETWKKNIIAGAKSWQESRRGKSFEEFYGMERATKYKEALSAGAKKREIAPMLGRKHSEETKQKIRESTVKQISLGMLNRVTKPQKKLFDFLTENYSEFRWQLEKNFKYYTADIASDDLMLIIETDGDFFHVNEALGYTVKYDIQKRTKKNEKTKDSYFKNKGWYVLRIWTSDIEDNFDTVKLKVREIICNLKK